MAGKSCITTLAAICVLFLLLSTTSDAKRHKKHPKPANNVSPFCVTATAQPDDQDVCTQLVKGGATWPEAMTNAIGSTIEVAKAAKPMVDTLGQRLPGGLRAATVDSLVEGCKEAYDSYVYNMEQCIGFVKNDPTSALETYLSGSSFSDCKDGFDEFEISNKEVNEFYFVTNKLASILLSIYQRKP